MNKNFIFIFSFLAFIFSEDKILWDLGVTIKSKDSNFSFKKNTDSIKALISNTQIAPLYKDNFKINLFDDIITSNIESQHIIKLLYLNNKYFQLTEFIESLKESDQKSILNDEQLLIYSDALSQIGNYNEAILNVNLLSDNYPHDEKYFLLALYNKKLGNINKTITLLNSLISEYPNSEYIKLAKLQTRELQ
tara:strand:- start:129 stop:704 length:576 start_codon:yes stop_codon:yes gene_type:complete